MSQIAISPVSPHGRKRAHSPGSLFRKGLYVCTWKASFIYFGCAEPGCCVGRSRCRARGWAADGPGPLVAGHGLWGVSFGHRGRAGSLVGAPKPQSSGSVVVVCRLGPSCSAVCGIFLNPGSNLCLLHWRERFFTPEPPEKPVWPLF